MCELKKSEFKIGDNFYFGPVLRVSTLFCLQFTAVRSMSIIHLFQILKCTK